MLKSEVSRLIDAAYENFDGREMSVCDIANATGVKPRTIDHIIRNSLKKIKFRMGKLK